MSKTSPEWRSKCHGVAVEAWSRAEGTSYYKCTRCHQPCDFFDLHEVIQEANADQKAGEQPTSVEALRDGSWMGKAIIIDGQLKLVEIPGANKPMAIYDIEEERRQAKIEELRTLLKEVPMPTLSYEQVENRIFELRGGGPIP